MTSVHSEGDFVEIYRTDSPAEAYRIRDVVLIPQGITAVVHDRMDHAFPAPSAQPGVVSVAVPMSQRDRAVSLIEEYEEAASESPEKGPFRS
ncbi:MAG: DUF2007 domain-containing protein [Deltaproteobacteria bacterium]|nr:DUF2007 domain-containing protein [Deltaproteobacteria bacterium]